ncbi:HD domain-containing protein [Patescibacteria group bacterium]|nr:HD domain-containing protein [Patescibacteria group bacterium]
MPQPFSQIIDFLSLAEKLKSTCRYNYTSTGRQESSAEHSWRLALMVPIVIKEQGIDVDELRSIKMALIHDLVEAVVGDISYMQIKDGEVSITDKAEQEKKAIEKIKELLPKNSGQEVYDLWHEYEEATSKEAKFIKALDKLETIAQIVQVGGQNFKRPELIPNYADKAVQNFPKLAPFYQELKKRLKEEFAKGGFDWQPEYD